MDIETYCICGECHLASLCCFLWLWNHHRYFNLLTYLPALCHCDAVHAFCCVTMLH